jgi:hypothetical protein
MSNQFERTAVKLSQGPLGIIALFIVLIHAFASLVLGLATNIGENNRAVLVWFLVSFPVLVLAIFAWLVSRHHAKLYPPQAFTQEQHFVSLAFGQASFDQPDAQAGALNKSATLAHALKTNAIGNLYWLGHDLMWSADVLLRKGPSEHVLIGLAQARHHALQAGLGESLVEHELRGLSELIRQSPELSPTQRDAYASQLGAMIDRIGMAVEAAQGNFKVPPYWNRARG